MADIIPFRTERKAGVAKESWGEACSLWIDESGHDDASWDKCNNISALCTEISKWLGKSSLTSFRYSTFDSQDPVLCDEAPIVESLSALAELVVFSMEIQRREVGCADPKACPDRSVGWGDVFVKTGEGAYRFLFTLYGEGYVRHQRLYHGEEIRPSPRDIVLKNEGLLPKDIVRAVIKWVNLYAPDLKGRPIRLESEEVLRDLVCDPGIEAVLSEPP